MQLAVVSALAGIARRSVWVGDRKQAIFGFQGSDPVLMGAAMAHALAGRAAGVPVGVVALAPGARRLHVRALRAGARAARVQRPRGADLDAAPRGRTRPRWPRAPVLECLVVGREGRAAAPSPTASRASSPRRRPSAIGDDRRGSARHPSGRGRARAQRTTTAARSRPRSRRAGSRRGSSSPTSRATPEAILVRSRRSRWSPIPPTASPRWTSPTSAAAGPPIRTAGSRRGSIEAARDRAARDAARAAGRALARGGPPVRGRSAGRGAARAARALAPRSPPPRPSTARSRRLACWSSSAPGPIRRSGSPTSRRSAARRGRTRTSAASAGAPAR